MLLTFVLLVNDFILSERIKKEMVFDGNKPVSSIQKIIYILQWTALQ